MSKPTKTTSRSLHSHWVAWTKALGPLAIAWGISLVLYLILPSVIGPFYTKIMMDVGIAMMLAVSLNIVNGMTGQFSIGHAGFMMVGGYTAGMITYYGSLFLWGSSQPHYGPYGGGMWLFAVACVIGGFVAAAAGYVVGLPALRLKGDYLAIATLGFGEIVRVLLQQTNDTLSAAQLATATWKDWLPPPVGGALGFSRLPMYTNLFWVLAFLSFAVIAAYRLKHSSLGRAMISVREDEIAAQAMGVNITRQKVSAFVLAGFLAGMAGGLYAHQIGVLLRPEDAGFQKSFDVIIMTVLGGKGSISGVMLAAGILTILPETLRGFDQYRLIVYALLLIFMMLVRPEGLCGVRELWEMFPFRRAGQPKTAQPKEAK